MKITLPKIITTFLLISNVCVCASQDYLVTKEKDTIYGKIEWKTNVIVYVKNESGKQKFRADKVDFFQRGAFRFVSVNTKFPEFLLEVKNGQVSYYVESHLKSKFTIDYKKNVFLKYKDDLYTITTPENNQNNNNNDNFFLDNPVETNRKASQEEFVSSNFKSSFYQILGKDNTLYKLIKKNNFTFEDIELLVDLSNKSLNYPIAFEKQIDSTIKKGYASGYVIPFENDTIWGSIKMKKTFLYNDKIKFITRNKKESSYKPGELIGFKINGRVYKNDIIDKKKKQLIQLIVGEISLYRDLKNKKSYIIKENREYILVDKKKKFIEIFKDKPSIYNRIIENDYQSFEVKSMIRLYNN